MWRQLSEASMPVDYPTNHQSFCNSWEDESACWITSKPLLVLLLLHPFQSGSRPGLPPHLLSHSVPSLGPGRSALKPFARPKEQNCRPRWFSFVSARLSIRFLLCICFMLQTLVCTCRDSAGGRFSRFQQRWVGGKRCGDSCMPHAVGHPQLSHVRVCKIQTFSHV